MTGDLWHLIQVKNPFDPRDRETRSIRADGRPVIAFLPLEPGMTFVFSINGKVVAKEDAAALVPRAGDYIVMCPVIGKGGGGGGKNPLQIIATLALTAVSFGVGAAAAAAWGTTAGMLATGAVMYLGGNLLSSMAPKPKVEMPVAADQSSFEGGYGWDQMRPLMTQGGVIPMTFGTVRVAGQCIGQHVTTDGKKQFLNLLLSGGEGPVDSISDLKINSNPIANFDTTVDGLRDTLFTQSLSLGVPVTKVTSADATSGFEVELTFPNGLSASSGWGMASVTVLIEYAPESTGVFETWVNEAVTGWQLQSLKKAWRKDGLSSEKYSVRVTVTANASNKAVQWTRLSDVDYSENVDVETRLGTNNQTTVSFFADTYADQLFQTELVDSDWAAYQTEGDGGRGLEIEFTFPQGLCYVNDDGSPSETWAKIDVEYRLVGAVDWTTWGTFEIRDDEQSPVRRSYRLNNLTAGQYEVQCKLNSVAGTTSRYINSCFWSRLTHIIYDDFRYPNMALVGIRAMATDKLSGGMPSISWVQTRSSVWVYVPGIGYTQKPATNPAWACYDIIHRARRLYDVQAGSNVFVVQGEEYSKIDYTAFSAWADHCDELVSGIKRCEVNLFVDAAGRLWEQVQKVAAMGRGMVLPRGTGYTAVWDAVVSPVQLFTVGNIEIDSLTGEFLSSTDRADAIEVSFNNEEKDYQRDTVIVYGDDFDTSSTLNNPTQVFLPGITNYRRAYREGLYRLRLNKYLKRSISFRADIDAIACQVGDVVLVQHDIPRWGYGGRLVAATSTLLTLDKTVTLRAGVTYQVKVRLSDDTLVEKTLAAVGSDTDTNQVTVTSAFTTVPAQFDIYALGESGKTSKPFRITKISRSGDQKVRIDALEYYSQVYDETATVPDIDYSRSLPTVKGLQLGFHFDMAGQGWLDILWSAPIGSYGGSIVSVDGKAVAKLGMTVTKYSHRVRVDKTYTVKVTGLSAAGEQTGSVSKSYTVSALSIPDVTNIVLTEDSFIQRDGTVLTDVPLTFTKPANYQFFKQANVYYQVDETGPWIFAGSSSNGQFRIKALKASKVQVDIRTVNTWNVEGSPTLSSVMNVVGKSWPPGDVPGFSVSQDSFNRAILRLNWSTVPESDIKGYEIREGEDWETGTAIHEGILPDPGFSYAVDAAGLRHFWIKAVDRSGNYSTNAVVASLTPNLNPSPVSSLAAVQDTQNKANLLISWVNAGDKDFSHCEIRINGSDWDSATVIGDKIKDPLLSYLLSASGTYTVRVRAVSIAGFYSDEVSLAASFTVEPATVTSLTAAQDTADRSILRISWTPLTEKDIKRYEVRLGGASWATAAVIGDKIAEPFFETTLASEGPLTVRVKAINRAGFYSEADASFIANIDLTPSDVPAFQALQNGAEVLLSWTKISDLDLIGYEIREGPAFSLGALVAELDPSKSSVSLPVAAERDYTYWIKAVNRSGHESATATKATVTVMDLPPKNVVQSWDELALQTGTHDNTEFGSSQYTFATIGGTFADYPTLRFNQAGSSQVLRLQTGETSGVYSCVQKDMGEIITAKVTCDWFVMSLAGAGLAGALEFRSSLNGSIWTDWAVFQPVTMTFRYLEFRIVLTSTDPAKTPEVTLCTIAVDVPDKELIFADHTISASGTEIQYGHTYHVTPSVTATALGGDRVAVLVSKDESKCFVKVRDVASGTYVSGTADIRVRGY